MASYVGLGTFQNIYAALAAGTIDAGILPVDLRFPGQTKYGWNAFETKRSAFVAPSIFGTTRRMIASNREVVLRAVRGFVETIYVFKTRRAIVAPLLQRYTESRTERPQRTSTISMCLCFPKCRGRRFVTFNPCETTSRTSIRPRGPCRNRMSRMPR